MNLESPTNPIPLPEEIDKAIEQARTNLTIMQAEHRNLVNASNALAITVQEQTAQKTHLEGQILALEDDFKSKNDRLSDCVLSLASAQNAIESTVAQDKEIRTNLAVEQNRINLEAERAKTKSNDLIELENRLNKRTAELEAKEKLHSERVSRLEEALRH